MHVLPCDPQVEHHHDGVPRKIIRVSVARTDPYKFDIALQLILSQILGARRG